MQGIFVFDSAIGSWRRPKSKKEIKAIASDNLDVRIEATSAFGNEFDGLLADLPVGDVYFVGPDPYTKRNFYGSITRKSDGTIVVK